MITDKGELPLALAVRETADFQFYWLLTDGAEEVMCSPILYGSRDAAASGARALLLGI